MTLRKVKDRGQQILGSSLAPQQKLAMIKETVIPLVHYSMGITPFNTRQVLQLESAILHTMRKALYLTR